MNCKSTFQDKTRLAPLSSHVCKSAFCYYRLSKIDHHHLPPVYEAPVEDSFYFPLPVSWMDIIPEVDSFLPAREEGYPVRAFVKPCSLSRFFCHSRVVNHDMAINEMMKSVLGVPNIDDQVSRFVDKVGIAGDKLNDTFTEISESLKTATVKTSSLVDNINSLVASPREAIGVAADVSGFSEAVALFTRAATLTYDIILDADYPDLWKKKIPSYLVRLLDIVCNKKLTQGLLMECLIKLRIVRADDTSNRAPDQQLSETGRSSPECQHNEAFSEAGSSLPVFAFAAFALATIISGSTPDPKEVAAINSRLSIFNTTASLARNYGPAVSDTLPAILNILPDCIQDVISTRFPDFLKPSFMKGPSDFAEWATAVENLSTPQSKVSMLVNQSTQKRVKQAYADGITFMRKHLDATSPYPPTYTSFLISRMKMIQELNAHIKRGAGPTVYRPEPFSIILLGKTGQGKSTLMPYLASRVVSDYTKKHVHGSKLIYRKITEDQYWSGYSDQPVVLIDDMGQFTTPDPTQSDWSVFFQLKGAAKLHLNMADLADKGTVFNSELIIGTTNTPYPKPPGQSTPEALWRRIDALVEIRIKKQFTDANGLLDRSKGQKYDIMNPTHLEARYLDPMAGRILSDEECSPWIEIEELALDLERRNNAHYEIQHGLKNAAELGVCNNLINAHARNEAKSVSSDDDYQDTLSSKDFLSIKRPPTIDDTMVESMIDSLRKTRENVYSPTVLATLRDCQREWEAEHPWLTRWVRAMTYLKPIIELTALTLGVSAMVYKIGSSIKGFFSDDKELDGKWVHDYENDTMTYFPKNGEFPKKIPQDAKGYSVWWKDEKASSESFVNDMKRQPRKKVVSSAKKFNGARHMVAANEAYVEDMNASELTKSIRKSNSIITIIVPLDPDDLSSNTGTIKAFCIRGQRFIFPRHVFFNKKTRVTLPDDGMIFWTVEGSIKKEHRFDHRRYMWCQTDDLAVYDFGVVMRPRKDYSRHFVTADVLSQLSHLQGDIVGEGHVHVIGANCNLESDRWQSYPLNEITVYIPGGKLEGRKTVSYPLDNKDMTTKLEKLDYLINYEGLPPANRVCGNLILARQPKINCGKILGFHVAGNDKQCYGLPITLETMEQLNDSLDQQMMVYFGNFASAIATDKPIPVEMASNESSFLSGYPLSRSVGNFEILGVLEKDSRPHDTRKTDIIPSPLQSSKIFPLTHGPAALMMNDPRLNTPVRPIEVGFDKKYGDPLSSFDFTVLESVAHSYGEYLSSLEHGKDAWRQVYTVDQMLNGDRYIPGSNGIDWTKSPGLPYILTRPRGVTGKAYLVDIEETPDGPHYWFGPNSRDLGKNFYYRLANAKKGYADPVVWRTVLKDELRPNEKVSSGLTRCIEHAAFDFVLLDRMYNGAFDAFLVRNPIVTGIGIGMDPGSRDFNFLYNKLRKVSRFGIDVDYKNWDAHCLGKLFEMEDIVRNIWYEDRDGINSDSIFEDRQVRHVITSQIVNALTVVDGNLIQMSCGQRSGQAKTATSNSVINQLVIGYAWMKLAPPEMRSYFSFQNHVFSCVYGDDLIMSISEEVLSWFNGISFQNEMAKVGMKVTSADKGVMQPFKPIEEMTFLKHAFVKHPSQDLMLGAIDLSTIHNLVNWQRNGLDPRKLFEDNILTALRYSYPHGKLFFDSFRRKVMKQTALAKCVTPGFVFPTYAEYDFAFLNDTHESEVNGDALLIGFHRMKALEEEAMNESNEMGAEMATAMAAMPQNPMITPAPQQTSSSPTTGTTIAIAPPLPTSLPYKQHPGRQVQTNVSLDLDKLLYRDYLITTLDITSTAVPGFVAWSATVPLGVLNNNTTTVTIQRLLANQFEMEFSITANSNPMICGTVALVYIPMKNVDQAKALVAANASTLFVQNMALLDLSANGVTAKVKANWWCYPDALNTYDKRTIDFMGTVLLVGVITPRFAPGAPAQVPVSIFAKITKMSSTIPVPKPLTVSIPPRNARGIHPHEAEISAKIKAMHDDAMNESLEISKEDWMYELPEETEMDMISYPSVSAARRTGTRMCNLRDILKTPVPYFTLSKAMWASKFYGVSGATQPVTVAYAIPAGPPCPSFKDINHNVGAWKTLGRVFMMYTGSVRFIIKTNILPNDPLQVSFALMPTNRTYPTNAFVNNTPTMDGLATVYNPGFDHSLSNSLFNASQVPFVKNMVQMMSSHQDIMVTQAAWRPIFNAGVWIDPNHKPGDTPKAWLNGTGEYAQDQTLVIFLTAVPSKLAINDVASSINVWVQAGDDFSFGNVYQYPSLCVTGYNPTGKAPYYPIYPDTYPNKLAAEPTRIVNVLEMDCSLLFPEDSNKDRVQKEFLNGKFERFIRLNDQALNEMGNSTSVEQDNRVYVQGDNNSVDGAATKIPVTQSNTVSTDLEATEGIADNPAIPVSAQAVFPEPTQRMNCDVVTFVHQLDRQHGTMPPTNEIRWFNNSIDWMNIKTHIQKFVPISVITWKNADPVGKQLYTRPLCPFPQGFNASVGTAYAGLHPLDWMTAVLGFSRWRGSFKFLFTATCTSQQSGSLMISSPVGTKEPSTDMNDLSNQSNIIWTINESQRRIRFTSDFVAPGITLAVPNGPIPAFGSWMEYYFRTLSVNVSQKISTSVASAPDITIMIWMAAGPDFELLGPGGVNSSVTLVPTFDNAPTRENDMAFNESNEDTYPVNLVDIATKYDQAMLEASQATATNTSGLGGSTGSIESTVSRIEKVDKDSLVVVNWIKTWLDSGATWNDFTNDMIEWLDLWRTSDGLWNTWLRGSSTAGTWSQYYSFFTGSYWQSIKNIEDLIKEGGGKDYTSLLTQILSALNAMKTNLEANTQFTQSSAVLLSSINNALQNISSKTDGINKDLITTRDYVASIDTKMTNLNYKIDALNMEVGVQSGKLDKLIAQASDSDGHLADIVTFQRDIHVSANNAALNTYNLGLLTEAQNGNGKEVTFYKYDFSSTFQGIKTNLCAQVDSDGLIIPFSKTFSQIGAHWTVETKNLPLKTDGFEIVDDEAFNEMNEGPPMPVVLDVQPQVPTIPCGYLVEHPNPVFSRLLELTDKEIQECTSGPETEHESNLEWKKKVVRREIVEWFRALLSLTQVVVREDDIPYYLMAAQMSLPRPEEEFRMLNISFSRFDRFRSIQFNLTYTEEKSSPTFCSYVGQTLGECLRNMAQDIYMYVGTRPFLDVLMQKDSIPPVEPPQMNCTFPTAFAHASDKMKKLIELSLKNDKTGGLASCGCDDECFKWKEDAPHYLMSRFSPNCDNQFDYDEPLFKRDLAVNYIQEYIQKFYGGQLPVFSFEMLSQPPDSSFEVTATFRDFRGVAIAKTKSEAKKKASLALAVDMYGKE